MGAGSNYHKEVVKFLNDEYGKSQDDKLKSIFPDDWEQKFIKERGFRCDYVGNCSQCNAIVDVIVSEPWMESLGKVIAYSNEVLEIYPDKEVWLIFYNEGLWKMYNGKYTKFPDNEERFVEYARAFCIRLRDISKKVLIPDLSKRLKFFDYRVEDGKGKLISL